MAASSRVGIVAMATASPAHELPQAQAKAFARSFFAEDLPDSALEVYDNAGVETRWTGRPIAWLEHPHTFAEKNQIYVEQALELGHRAGSAALERAEQAGVDRSEIGAIVFASSTGIATPSLDARLVQSLGLSRAVERVPLWGLGCAGGGAGLARARALALGLNKPVLTIACELCSLTFVHGDRRKANLVAVALFGDGAAATVVAPEPYWGPEFGHGPELLGGYAKLIDDSEAIMGWDLEPEGLRVRFAPTIPELVVAQGGAVLVEAAASAGFAADAIRHLVVHPGGRRVLDAWTAILDVMPGLSIARDGLPADPLRFAREVLREHGNMSSPTVLFVLERFLANTPASDAPGLLLTLGPGFSAEGVVFRW